VFGVVALIVAVVALLGMRRRYEHRAVFPTSPPVARLAMRSPLVRPDLSVAANVRASKNRVAPIWMTVDSGATGVTLTNTTFAPLGLDMLTGVKVRSEDPLGRTLVREAGLLPELALGDLVVEDVGAAIGGEATVLGQSVLAYGTWEIDWDRGLLTLGASPWPEGGDTTFVPLRTDGDAEIVSLTMDGTPLDMIVDTGARLSTIPESVGTRSGLAMQRGRPTTLNALGGGELVVHRLFSGEARLGSRDLGNVVLAALATGGRRAGYGLLGLDVLSRFHLQIVPGSHLALRPRGDERKTAAERVARWSFVPRTCEHLGCVRVERAPRQLVMTLEADLAQTVELWLACTDDHVAGHVRVGVARGPLGATSKTSLPAEFECPSLQVVDVAPIPPPGLAVSPMEPQPDVQLQAGIWQ